MLISKKLKRLERRNHHLYVDGKLNEEHYLFQIMFLSPSKTQTDEGIRTQDFYFLGHAECEYQKAVTRYKACGVPKGIVLWSPITGEIIADEMFKGDNVFDCSKYYF